MRSDRAAAFDWGRRRVARPMQGRTFGDVDVDAVVLLAVIEAFVAARSGRDRCGDPLGSAPASPVLRSGRDRHPHELARFSPMILRIHSSGRPSCLV